MRSDAVVPCTLACLDTGMCLPTHNTAAQHTDMMRQYVFLLLVGAVHALARYSKFRTLPVALALEWKEFLATIGGAEKLANTALLHHRAADAFCRKRQ